MACVVTARAREHRVVDCGVPSVGASLHKNTVSQVGMCKACARPLLQCNTMKCTHNIVYMVIVQIYLIHERPRLYAQICHVCSLFVCAYRVRHRQSQRSSFLFFMLCSSSNNSSSVCSCVVVRFLLQFIHVHPSYCKYNEWCTRCAHLLRT